MSFRSERTRSSSIAADSWIAPSADGRSAASSVMRADNRLLSGAPLEFPPTTIAFVLITSLGYLRRAQRGRVEMETSFLLRPPPSLPAILGFQYSIPWTRL